MTAKELTTHSLESELKEIVRERDKIEKDRFDHLIEECTILDYEFKIEVADFFEEAAEDLAGSLHVSKASLVDSFLERESESTTVLNPDLAIPHIIIGGDHEFNILLARNKEGFYFSEENPRVHTVFVLIGTKDERPFHLRALAAIGQIVQDPNFEKKWMEAKNIEALRDLVLLSKRRRNQ